MKRILVTLCAVALCFSATAQTDYVETWDPDADGDGLIGVSDLLALLGVFQEEDMDNDGIWDSQDDCVGEYDECGVCNGEGIPDGYCTCSLMIDALGECGGDCANDADGDGVCDDYYGPCFGSETLNFDGYTYDLVAIGDQCWFAENLRTEHYANGDAIPANLPDEEWGVTTSGAVTVYGEGLDNSSASSCQENSPDGDACAPEWSLNEYGRLYNWYAVGDERGLCPTDWHVPTDEEWMTLEMELGMSASDANSFGWRGIDQGTQLKTTYGWYNGSNGTDSSGFSGLPGGKRHPVGTFFEAGSNGSWWSSSSSGASAWYRYLSYGNPFVGRSNSSLPYGFSVRCLKDAE